MTHLLKIYLKSNRFTIYPFVKFTNNSNYKANTRHITRKTQHMNVDLMLPRFGKELIKLFSTILYPK